MIRNLVLIFLFALLFVVTPFGVYFLGYSGEAAFDDQKIKYNLPYPGVLPDNPLYFLKSARDNIVEFMTRDNIKKARLYLNSSDKKMAMSLLLEKKGREKMAVQTVIQGEKDFIKLASLLKEAKKQGVSPEGEFVLNIKLSNEKHREVIQTLQKELSSEKSTDIIQALKTNEAIKKEISKL